MTGEVNALTAATIMHDFIYLQAMRSSAELRNYG